MPTKPLEKMAFISYVSGAYRDISGDPFSADQMARMFSISLEQGLLNQACRGGYFSISAVGGGGGRGKFVVIEDNSGPAAKKNSTGSPGKVASRKPATYNHTRVPFKRTPDKENVMPARARAAVEPEVEATEPEDNGVKDYTGYATKEPTAAMQDYVQWLGDVGAKPEFGTQKEEAAFAHGVRLGGTLRMEFQRSEFNQAQREARRAAKLADSAAEPAEAEVEEAPAPKATGRKPRAAAAPKPAAPKRGRGKPVGAASGAQPF